MYSLHVSAEAESAIVTWCVPTDSCEASSETSNTWTLAETAFSEGSSATGRLVKTMF